MVHLMKTYDGLDSFLKFTWPLNINYCPKIVFSVNFHNVPYIMGCSAWRRQWFV